MKETTMQLQGVLLLSAVLAITVSAQDRIPAKLKDAAEESAKAAETLREIMSVPEKAIPREVLDAAECVAVFPSTIKGGFIIGAQKGEGVVSCRTPRGWSAPAFLDMAGGSVGAQIGAQATDYILLVMNESGVGHLLSNKFTIGGEASVAAGPVGRAAAAATDWKLKAQILSYSRSRGLFAGATLNGVSITTDGSDIENVYGPDISAKAVLIDATVTAPEEVQALPKMLSRYSSRNAKP